MSVQLELLSISGQSELDKNRCFLGFWQWQI